MTYYKAVELSEKPYMQWDSWANSYEEYVAFGLENNPLIIAESDLPEFKFGVCPMKIVDGELVNRAPEEMAAFEAEYIAASGFRSYGKKIVDVDKALFVYDGNSFPMHNVARLYYSCILRTSANYKVQHTTGIYDLAPANISAFLDAYYSKMKILTQP